MPNRTKSKATHQAAKPYPDFPLTAHATGRWAKKHRGKRYYFGKLDDWQGALERFKREWPYITEGRTPPLENADNGCTMQSLCNAFLNSKRIAMEVGDLAARTFGDYHMATDALIAHFGRTRRVDDLQPSDFEKYRAKLAGQRGTVSLKNDINRARVVFKYASDNRLIDSPVNYGQAFNRPSAKVLRKARNEAGPRMFESAEIRRILDKADPTMRAMVLLGCNAGFGNSDLANIPQSAIDFDSGWIDFPRVKTAIPRRVPLWPETIEALRVAIAKRPAAADKIDGDMVFLTAMGNRWVRVKENQKTKRPVPIDALSQKFAKLLQSLKINGRSGLGFYTLRHNFQTIGGDAKDPEAVAAIMGHVDSSMGAVYRERIPDERLKAVTDTVHRWLFDEPVK